VRTPAGSKFSVSLTSIQDLAHVNSLSSGPVTFAPEGLTVIYGDNASGKSGIARILKKVGRARDPGGPILPCVFEPDPGRPASATILFRDGAADHSYSWVDGVPNNNELKEINIFDASCAAVQIEESNRLAYTPQVLQVFQDLAEASQKVSAKLKAEKDLLEGQSSQDIRRLSLRSSTAAGILVAGLSADTTSNAIDALCDIRNDDKERFTNLFRVLQDNPASQAALLEAHARRLKEVDDLTLFLSQSLSDLTMQGIEADISTATTTIDAARVAREVFAENSTLAGIGSPIWKELWESARRYSQTSAYPSFTFPVTSADALCVLCQQPISRIAAERLKAFEQFVQADVQKRAETAQRALQNRIDGLRNLRIPFSGTLRREALLSDASTVAALKTFIVAVKSRRRFLLRRLAGLDATRPGILPAAPDLTVTRATIAEEIARLRAAAQTDERRKMQSEWEALEDRLKIAPLKNTLKNEASRLKYCRFLDFVRSDCDTTWITRKAGEVAKQVVTARLRSAFAANLAHLGFASAPVEVKLGAGSTGQYPYKISLVASEHAPPAQILSEGERTCVALAGLLAELDTSNNSSSIILDDPVSSLDHHYRLRVARLLVESAKERQVIVFTHDIVFLLMLTRYGRAAGIAIKESSLRRGGLRHGIPEEGPPWVAMHVNKRIGVLRNELQAADTLLRRGERTTYEQKAEWIYERLRQSWERGVEEVLLNGVVVRFGDGVSTTPLRKLTDITDTDVQTVETEMSYCSSFVHDESGAVNSGIPDPSVIGTDIKRLEDWIDVIRKRRK
jgi:energy-coupling factor transporter ATP-binding protein EcfA2